ncbi:CLUMA_CG011242, isoform A [Clunio marinus]|uniref:CLUMA_CG011242, isoform A n=1 Tax=Clunio marinus TaxID=568069 RepID=A0A1J1ICE2_9DIPT|nr:CLUMA_CG011242, isoform A [Clunio marinus]
MHDENVRIEFMIIKRTFRNYFLRLKIKEKMWKYFSFTSQIQSETIIDKLMTFQINKARPGTSRVTDYLLSKAYFADKFMIVCMDFWLCFVSTASAS